MQYLINHFRWILLFSLPVAVLGFCLIWLLQKGWGLTFILDPVLVICLLFFIYLHLSLFSHSYRFLTKKNSPYIIFGVLGLGYLIYSIKSNSFSYYGFVKHTLYLLIPMLVSGLNEKFQYFRKTYSDLFFIFWMWLFFDLRWLHGIWVWPDVGLEYPLSTIVLMITLMVWFQGRIGSESGLPLQLTHLKVTCYCLLIFCLIVIPVGFMSEFLTWNPSTDFVKWILSPLGILFFIALPEELVFRGLILTIIARHYNYSKHQSYGKPLMISSILFGLSHFNNPPLNDWRYLSLSTLAGFFYGYTYLRAKNLGAPVLLHTLVDYLWIQLFLNKV